MIRVKAPATSANMGPGFDCMGIALNIFNTVEAQIIPEGLEIETYGRDAGLIENDDTNLIYRAMKKVFTMTGYSPAGLKITSYNEIPVARRKAWAGRDNKAGHRNRRPPGQYSTRPHRRYDAVLCHGHLCSRICENGLSG